MLGLKSNKSAPKEEPAPPIYWIVTRFAGASRPVPATREQAIDAFNTVVAEGHFHPRARRRVFVTGPDYRVWPEDDDPLLIGDAAVKAVLTPVEYEAYVMGPVAEALVMS